MMSILLALITFLAPTILPGVLGREAAPPSRTAGAARAAYAPLVAPKTLAVLYFDNHTGDPNYDALGRGLAAMMISDISGVEGVRVVERERLQDLVKEMDAQRTRYFDSTTAVKVGRLAGAEFIVTGAITAVKPRIGIDTRVMRVETGEIVKTAQVHGDEEKFFELQQKLAKRLTDDLELALSPEAQEQLRQRQERNRIDRLRTISGVANALAQFDRGDYAGALLTMGPVMRDSPTATVVTATYAVVQRRAQAKAENSLKEKANTGLKGLINKKWP
jgi:TolB-like protein